jgi:hypothetical protein
MCAEVDCATENVNSTQARCLEATHPMQVKGCESETVCAESKAVAQSPKRKDQSE